MKKVHYDKFGYGSAICGIPFAEHITRDVSYVTCHRCLYAAPFRLKDAPEAILARISEWLFSDPKHRFVGGRCTRCGCSESAVEHFGWPCK
jgi:hypothetical protein